MSYLTDFTPPMGPANWIRIKNNVPPNTVTNYGNIPQTSISSTNITAQGIGVNCVTGLSTNGSDNFNTAGGSAIYAGACDTIEGNYSARISGGGNFIMTSGTNRVKTIKGLNFTLGNHYLYVTDTSSTNLTDLSIGYNVFGFGFFAEDPGGASGYLPNLANVTLNCSILRLTSSNCQFNLRGCALTAKSVENILVAFDGANYLNLSNFSINLSGGTSSGAGALTAAAAAARTSLLAKGVASITLNP